MEIITDRSISIKEETAITIGKFDGVHLGHKKLIDEVIKKANEKGIKSLVMTFDNLSSGNLVQNGMYLSTSDEKAITFARMKLDYLLIYHFDKALKEMPAKAFVEDILIDKLNMKILVVGSDFFFGKDKEGDIDLLKTLSKDLSFDLEILEKKTFMGDDISSSHIKSLLKDDKLEEVNRLLTSPYIIAGYTKKGKQIGRHFGVPTMNIYPEEDKILPTYGVYAAKAIFNGQTYNAVVNIGVRPTVSNDNMVSVESHILEGSLPEESYGLFLQLFLIKKIREEKKFSSKEDLFAQMDRDKYTAFKILK